MPSLIGTAPNQVPVNGMLGRMAFQDPGSVVLELQATASPSRPGELVFWFVNNTNIGVRMMGIDGVVRQTTLLLA